MNPELDPEPDPEPGGSLPATFANVGLRWTRRGRLGERKLYLLPIQQCSNGFPARPDNDKELTLAIAILLRDEPHRNIGIAGRDTILDRLTLPHQAENLARIF